MEADKCVQSFGGNPEMKRPLGIQKIVGRIIFRWIFKKWDVKLRTG